MRQRFIILAFFAVIAGFFSSCSDSKTYAEQLQEEESSIQTFILDRGYTITSVIPDTVPWPNGVFYKTESGLYVHVIDTGITVIDTIPTNTVINVRYLETDMNGDTTYTNMKGSSNAAEIMYGNIDSQVSWDCLAWHEPLDYVGDGGHVYIITPADLGMSAYTSSGALVARFYELRYNFWK